MMTNGINYSLDRAPSALAEVERLKAGEVISARQALGRAYNPEAYGNVAVGEAVATEEKPVVDGELFDDIASKCLDGADVAYSPYGARRVSTGVGLGSEYIRRGSA